MLCEHKQIPTHTDKKIFITLFLKLNIQNTWIYLHSFSVLFLFLSSLSRHHLHIYTGFFNY